MYTPVEPATGDGDVTTCSRVLQTSSITTRTSSTLSFSTPIINVVLPDLKKQGLERLKALTKFENEANLSDEVKLFYHKTRGYILQGYLTSQHFLTNVKQYHLIPGPIFKGCVPVVTKNAV